MPTLGRDAARQRLIDEALAERVAEAERVKQMHREFMARKLSEAEERRLAGEPDAEDEEEEEHEDEDEELERMHQRVIEQRKELAARSREAERRILDYYDPKQGGPSTTLGSTASMTSPHSTTTRSVNTPSIQSVRLSQWHRSGSERRGTGQAAAAWAADDGAGPNAGVGRPRLLAVPRLLVRLGAARRTAGRSPLCLLAPRPQIRHRLPLPPHIWIRRHLPVPPAPLARR
ncbi:hypothetical protein U9M48_041511 [Paspalum notatum var. saurae]|uniref:Uncharacterized protein n=1 Tax=Paspalum notatum var. saurae TaxID=547442 RepID=A0AAQ3UPD0_PASNO